jgi:hypothetical protein
VHHKTQLARVLERFPEAIQAIRKAFLRDDRFRTACEDYALACDCLARFEALPDAEGREEVADYRSVIAELETELAALLSSERR